MSARQNDSDFLLEDMEMIFDDDSEGVGDFSFTKNGHRDNAEDSAENDAKNSAEASGSGVHNELQEGTLTSNVSFDPRVSNNAESRSPVASLNAMTGEETKIHSWDAEAAEKGVRQTMILEIARLLKSRKKTQPSNEWLQQLPHKARKLEERLYRAAPSLSAYQDLSTLKTRLQMVAQMITNQYAAAKSRHSFVVGGSRRMSALTALRNSFSSTQHRGSVNSQDDVASLLSNPGAFFGPSGTNDAAGVDKNEGMMNDMGEHKPLTSDISKQQRGSVSSMASTNSQPVGLPVPNGTGSAAPSHNGSTNSSSLSILEQQKAVNESLRLQIQENIRKQNEWFRQMQAQQAQPLGNASVTSAGIVPQTTAAIPPTTGSGLNVPIGGQAGAMGTSETNPLTAAASANQFGTMSKHMAAMGMAAGMQHAQAANMPGMQQPQQPQAGSMHPAGMATGFPFVQNSAALMNNPAAAARLQALLLQQQQQQQNGLPNSMNMMSSRIPPPQQNQFAQSQQQQARMSLGSHPPQFPQQQQQQQQQAPPGVENLLGGPSVVPSASVATANNNNNNNAKSSSGNSAMQPPQHPLSSTTMATPPNSLSSSCGGSGTMPPPAFVGSKSNHDNKDSGSGGEPTNKPPGNRPLSPGSFHW